MIMQRQRQQHHQSQHMFTASKVAEFEYCPLLWWHEEFEPFTQADTEELFAHMVEMEHDQGQAATTLPEYQVIEQLLLRRGAFDEGRQDDPDQVEAVSEREEELVEPAHNGNHMRALTLAALVMLVLALLLILASFLLASNGQNILHNITLPAGLALLALALVLFLLLLNERRYQQARLQAQRRRELGLPSGELVYEDADGQGEPLSSREFPLVGKPTYIVQLPDGRPVPIELKRNVQNLKEPQSNHIAQIGAYCLILEDYFEVPPTHGVLRYADREFMVDYTPTLRKKVLRILKDMGNSSEQYPPSLTRQRATKCRACLFQPICPVGQGK
jgi:CRISPR-associated exonuclease Cas4